MATFHALRAWNFAIFVAFYLAFLALDTAVTALQMLASTRCRGHCKSFAVISQGGLVRIHFGQLLVWLKKGNSSESALDTVCAIDAGMRCLWAACR